eukprot:3531326-Ditylum_brightwellii.AAC.1
MQYSETPEKSMATLFKKSTFDPDHTVSGTAGMVQCHQSLYYWFKILELILAGHQLHQKRSMGEVAK